MRLPVAAHTQRPWRIHRIAPDFAVLDVWSYRAPGAGPDDLTTFLGAIGADAARGGGPLPVRLLFAVRWKLGELFGWDEQRPDTPTLIDRLPLDLRQPESGAPVPHMPFSLLYRVHDEAAMELANETVHGVMHLGWTRGEGGDYRLQMAVLVKPNGLLGRVYLAAIAPFRYLIIYPGLARQWERAWRERAIPTVN